MNNGTVMPLADGEDKSTVSKKAKEIVSGWLQQFETSLRSKEAAKLKELFTVGGWLKDELAFSWDTRTLHGISAIVEYIQQNETRDGLYDLQISSNPHFLPTLKEMGLAMWIESGFEFKNDIGRGRGILRLTNVAVGEWKAWAIFTTLEELRDYPRIGRSHFSRRKNPPQNEGDAAISPTVVIIGAGSAGLSMAACLQDLSVQTLVIDRGQRVGDTWRKRYKSLELHSPSYGDMRPFLDIPGNWPIFPSKDQYADYLEVYARMMNINIWLETEFNSAQYDDNSRTWTVLITTTGGMTKALHPRHIVWAGSPFIHSHPIIPIFTGREEFKGLYYHAGEHQDAADIPNVRGKKVIVIGSNTTAHDICQDFAEAGAMVTMFQRSSTAVVSSQALLQFAMPPPPPGQGNEDYLFKLRSLPTFVLLDFMARAMPLILQFDNELIAGLDKTGFVASKGIDGDSFFRRGLLTRGGFYVNSGASELIISGEIKVLHCSGGIKKLNADGIVLADGRTARADVIVLATGWRQIEEGLSDVMGDEVASRATRVNQSPTIDAEGQPPGIFRPTGHPGFWVTAGNLLGSSMNSMVLALQIQATEVDINKRYA